MNRTEQTSYQLSLLHSNVKRKYIFEADFLQICLGDIPVAPGKDLDELFPDDTEYPYLHYNLLEASIENISDEERGLCASTSLLSILGTEHVPASQRGLLIYSDFILQFLEHKSQELRLSIAVPTSSTDFLNLMEEDATEGALIRSHRQNEQEGHIIAIIPITTESNDKLYAVFDIRNRYGHDSADQTSLSSLYASASFIHEFLNLRYDEGED